MKKIILLSAIFILSIITIWVFSATSPGNRLTEQKNIEKISINPTMKINLDLMAKDIHVYGWDKDNVEVQINNRIYGGNKTVIEAKDNNIALKSNVKADRRGLLIQTLWPWLSLIQFEGYGNIWNDDIINLDFIIYLPKDTPVHIQAGELSVRNCKLSSFSAHNVIISNCAILKGFTGTAGKISVRDSIISKNSNFKSQNTSFENNTYIDD